MLACKFCSDKSVDNLMAPPLYIKSFPLVALNILSLSLTFDIINKMCLIVSLFIQNFLGILDLDICFLLQIKEGNYSGKEKIQPLIFQVRFLLPTVWCCLISPLNYLHLFSFFYLFALLGELHCLLFKSIDPFFCFICWISVVYFLNSITVFLNSVTSIWYFLIFSISLLKFSLCSSILFPSLVRIFMTSTFNSLSGKVLNSASLRFFMWVYLVLSFGTYSSVWFSVLVSI